MQMVAKRVPHMNVLSLAASSADGVQLANSFYVQFSLHVPGGALSEFLIRRRGGGGHGP